MSAFLARRLASMVLVWLGVTVLTFLIANVVPSDPVALRLGPKATPAAIARWRHEFGLDLPLPQQYARYLSGLLRGDLGVSIWSGRPITRDLSDYLPGTLELAVTALLLSAVVGIPMGLWTARDPGGALDKTVQTLATFSLALPLFWLGLVFQLLFYRNLGWLPLGGRIDLLLGPPNRLSGIYLLDSLLTFDGVRFGSSLVHLALPSITLSLPAIGAVARMTRVSILEVMHFDYVRTAYAKGLTARAVLWVHVLRNALLPVVTLLGNLFNGLLAGVFVVEAVFDWPGLGWYATRVILASDYGSVVSITLVIAVLSTLVNLLVDILYHWMDPRIQFS